MKIKIVDNPRMVSDTLADSLAAWNWFMNSKRYWWFVAFEHKLWLAYAALSVYNKTTAYFGPDYVIKEVRGLRLQLKLIRYREKWARGQGFKRALAVVEHNNIFSANNYIKAGYLLRDPWPGFGPENKCLWFTKEL